jgi:hypothetical protein
MDPKRLAEIKALAERCARYGFPEAAQLDEMAAVFERDVPDLLAEVERLSAHLEVADRQSYRQHMRTVDLDAGLRHLEWVDPESRGARYCLACHQSEEHGHAADCWLAALLRPTGSGPSAPAGAGTTPAPGR